MPDTQKHSTDASKRLPTASLFVAVLAISFAAVFFRKAAPTHPLVAAGFRLAIASALLAPLALRSIQRRSVSWRLVRTALLAGFFYGMHFGAWVSSLTMTSVAASVTLVTTTPILLAIWGSIRGSDRPGGRWWLSLGVALIGLMLIGGHDLGMGSDALFGDILAFLGAVAMSGYMLCAKNLGKDMNLWVFSALATFCGAVLLLGTAFLSGIPLRAASDEALVYILLAALIPQLIGHNLITWSLGRLQPSAAAMTVVGEPVGATFLSWLWLKETVPSQVAIGCIVTLVAVTAAMFSTKMKNML